FWLGTVPLTQGLIAQIYGLRYAATLSGIAFLGHQVGSFIGVWLGGYVYASTGNYDLMWWIGVALAVVAALLCLPVRVPVLARRVPQAAWAMARTIWRILGGIALVAVLALGFLGYTMPGLRLNWETLAAMWGF